MPRIFTQVSEAVLSDRADPDSRECPADLAACPGFQRKDTRKGLVKTKCDLGEAH